MNPLLRCVAARLLLTAAVISLVFNLDYTGSGLGSAGVPVLKYLPYSLAAIASIILLFSVRIRLSGEVIAISCVLTLMLMGSLYAFLVMHRPVEETYLGRALGGFVFVACYGLAMDGILREWFLARVVRIFFFVSLLMATATILFRMGLIGGELTQIYHADVPILVAGVFLSFLVFRHHGWIRCMSLAYIIIASFLNAKVTGILVVLLAITMLTAHTFRHFWEGGGMDRTMRTALVGLVILFGIVLFLIMAVGAYELMSVRLAERGNELRMITMLWRWEEFLSSPWLGNLFSGSPLVDVDFLHIPSHSDVLDVLAFGGLLSFFLLLVPLFRICLTRTRADDSAGLFLKFLLFGFLLVMAVNPVLAQPRLGFWFFLSFGMLTAGLATEKKAKACRKPMSFRFATDE